MELNGSVELRLRDTKHASETNTKLPSNSTNDVKVVVMDDPKVKVNQEQGRFSRIKERCVGCCSPCLRSRNPLPDNPNLFQRLRHGLMLPPHGNVASYLQFAIVCVQIWIVIYALTHEEALPGGNLYSLLILFIACAIGGYIIAFIHLPPLLGMLIVGVMLRNIPGIKTIGESVDMKWSGALRKIALTVILTRAGLGLDPIKLKKLSWAVLRLAFTPCVAEAITVGIVSHFLIGFPWKWSLMLGCILGALSPAVTVPSLVNLQERQYGVAKGIPTMLLAAGGLDNVMCVTGFSVFLGIIFSDGDLAVTIIKGPIGVIVGIVYGFVMGILLWYLPAKDSTNHVFYRSMLLFGSGMVAIFGSSAVGLSGAGPLGCLTTATVAAYKWRQRRLPGEQDEIAGVMALAWLIMQHFLFGLIGSAVDINNIQANTAGLGIATLAIGLVIRSAVSFSVTLGTGFDLKERLFITLTWLSKATVQAAIGGLALDRVKEGDNPSDSDIKLGTDVLTISVLAIVICAPTGATLMALLGPRFLVKGYGDEESEVNGKEERVKDSKVSHIEQKVETVKIDRSAVNHLPQYSDAKGTKIEIDVRSGQICSECVDKEIKDIKDKEVEDIKKTLKDTSLLPSDEPATVVPADTSNAGKENIIAAVKVGNVNTEAPEVKLDKAVTNETNMETENDISGTQEFVKRTDYGKQDMSQDNQSTDDTADKSTETDEVQNEKRRPLYVSSIVVDLHDSKT